MRVNRILLISCGFYTIYRYVNYKMTERSLQDRNFGTLKPTRKGEEVHGETCPVVSHDRGAEQKTEIDDFYYSPSALEIPNIDVPESLPDLPGIGIENCSVMLYSGYTII